jgi:hypothetical protein
VSLREWWHSADSSVKVHRVLKWLWICPGLPISFVLRESVPWLVFMSVYAIITSHWGAEQAGIVEKKQEEAEAS